MNSNEKQNFLVKGRTTKQYRIFTFEDDVMFTDFCLESHSVKCADSDEFYYPFTQEYLDASKENIHFRIKDPLSNTKITKRVLRGRFSVEVENVI